MVEVQHICLQRESLGFLTLNNELTFFSPSFSLSFSFPFQVSSPSLMDVLLIKACALERGPSPHKAFSSLCFAAV